MTKCCNGGATVIVQNCISKKSVIVENYSFLSGEYKLNGVGSLSITFNELEIGELVSPFFADCNHITVIAKCDGDIDSEQVVFSGILTTRSENPFISVLRQQSNDTITWIAESDNSLLYKKVIAYEEGSTQAFKSMPADKAICEFVAENSGQSINPTRGSGNGYSCQSLKVCDSCLRGNGRADMWEGDRSYENLGETIEKISSSYGVDWEVTYDNCEYTFCIRRGVDRTYPNGTNPILLSDKQENIIVASYLNSISEMAHIAIVHGDNEVVEVAVDDLKKYPCFCRREIYVDGTKQTTSSSLETLGREALQQNRRIVELKFTPDTCRIQLGRDFFVGDRFTAVYNGQTFDHKVTGYGFTVDSTGFQYDTIRYELVNQR